MDLRQIVRERAQAHGVDPNIAEAVMMAESGGKPNALSPAGAYGPMQLMEPTARGLGVDRNDPYQNIDGGVRYLKENLTRFNGDVGSALAAYNAGPGRVSKTSDFSQLPQETRNYVPKVMNMAASFADRQQPQQPVGQPSGQPSSIDLGSLHSMFGKASEANDSEAVAEIGGVLTQQYGNMLKKAQAAGDQAAVAEITQAMSAFTPKAVPTPPPAASVPAPAVAKAPTVAPAAPHRSVAGNLGLGVRNVAEGLTGVLEYPVKAVGEAAAGVAGLFGNKELSDTLSRTIGMKNRGAGALAADTLGLAKPETKAEKVVAEATKAATGLVTGTGVARLAEKAPQAVKAALSILTPGTSGSAGNVAKDVGIYGGLGASMEAAPAETAAALAVLAGGKAAAGKVAQNRAVDKFIKNAGGDEGARIAAEVTKDFRRVATNPDIKAGADSGQATVAAVLRNQQASRYVDDVVEAVKRVEPSLLKQFDVATLLKPDRVVTQAELEGMRSAGKSGEVLADAVQKYQKAMALTAPTPASGSVGAKIARFGIENIPRAAAAATGASAMGPAGLLLGAITPSASGFAQRLTGKASIPEIITKLSSDKKVAVADEVLRRLGPSRASQGAENIADLARKAEATMAAQKAAKVTAKADKVADATTKQQEKIQATLEAARAKTVERANIANQRFLAGNTEQLTAERIAQQTQEAGLEAARQQTIANANAAGLQANQRTGAALSAERQGALKQSQGALTSAASEQAALEQARTETVRRANEATQRNLKSNQANLLAERAAAETNSAADIISRMSQGNAPVTGGGSMKATVDRMARDFNLDEKGTRDLIGKLRDTVDDDGKAILDKLLKGEKVPELFKLQDTVLAPFAEKSGFARTAPPTGALSGETSRIFNPASYKANVDNAKGALENATSAAPTKELAQFAKSVASEKLRTDKAKELAERLSKATDPTEIQYLQQFVEPLTKFGSKAKK